jgi:hypothetical protein
MPDYSNGSVLLTETKPFRDWLTIKKYSWPPVNLDERYALVCQFQREGMEEYLRSQAGKIAP